MPGSAPVVEPDEYADLIRSLAEAGGKARIMRYRLEESDSPLAWLASLRLTTIEAQIDSALEGAREAAKVVTTPTDQ